MSTVLPTLDLTSPEELYSSVVDSTHSLFLHILRPHLCRRGDSSSWTVDARFFFFTYFLRIFFTYPSGRENNTAGWSFISGGSHCCQPPPIPGLKRRHGKYAGLCKNSLGSGSLTCSTSKQVSERCGTSSTRLYAAKLPAPFITVWVSLPNSSSMTGLHNRECVVSLRQCRQLYCSG